jgi:Cu/Zn superoxide dismutase
MAGGAGTPSDDPTAMAEIEGFEATSTASMSGTATFTQGENGVTLVVALVNCPEGMHAAHLHETKSCGNDGNAAGGHWVPNGEEVGEFMCDGDGNATHTVTQPTSTWTVGGPQSTDVTQFAFVVHESGEPSPGTRIACGVVDLVE